MPDLVTLDEDGPLGPAGSQVWVDDPADVEDKPKPRKTAAKRSTAKDNES